MLADVVIMRLGLIFLLIGTHTFAPYSGSWDALPHSDGIEFYAHISSFTHFISMPALIFISGYLFGHSWHKVKGQSFKEFALKKLKRLILPCIVFSIFYFVLFNDYSQTLHKIAYYIVNGAGHLWFLPMLFWCFLFTYLIHKFEIPFKLAFPILIIFSILPIPELPLRLSSTFTYLIYFYIGFVVRLVGGGKSLPFNLLVLLTLTIGYIVLQIGLFEAHLLPKNTLIEKLTYLFSLNSLKLLLGLSGTGIAFVATRMFLSTGITLSINIITLSTYCYGVYIFHQFILKLIYYKTPITEILDPVVLPWISFCLTLLLSVSLTAMSHKTRIGRFLIG